MDKDRASQSPIPADKQAFFSRHQRKNRNISQITTKLVASSL